MGTGVTLTPLSSQFCSVWYFSMAPVTNYPISRNSLDVPSENQEAFSNHGHCYCHEGHMAFLRCVFGISQGGVESVRCWLYANLGQLGQVLGERSEHI